MSYKSAVAAYHRMREQHQGNPEALAMVAQFGMEVAEERVADVLHASAIACILIEKARQTSADPSTN